MKVKRKILNLSIEFNDREGLLKAFEDVKKSIIPPVKTNYERKMLNKCFISWSILSTEFEDFEVKEINGQMCYVLQSKMNKNV